MGGRRARRHGLREFDAQAHDELWEPEPRFAAPTLGLTDVSAGEVVLATLARFRDTSTFNRALFDAATGAEGEEAARLWRTCLASGDAMAHYGLGYTLVNLGDFGPAYEHLRCYVELVPQNAWAWCWLGRACAGLDATTEARAAYERAVELAGDETDAPELLDALA